MQDPHLDLFSVASMLLAIAVGPQYAPALAAYIVILLGAIFGTLPALKNREQGGGSVGALLFVMALVAWSCGITFSVSIVIQQRLGLGWQWTLFPVAFGISAMGERWLQAPPLLWAGLKRAYASALSLLPRQGGQP